MNDIRIGDHVKDLKGWAGVVTAPDGDLNVWVTDGPGLERSVLTSRLSRTRRNGGQS